MRAYLNITKRLKCFQFRRRNLNVNPHYISKQLKYIKLLRVRFCICGRKINQSSVGFNYNLQKNLSGF